MKFNDEKIEEKNKINVENKKCLASEITTTNIVKCKHAQDAQGVAGERTD